VTNGGRLHDRFTVVHGGLEWQGVSSMGALGTANDANGRLGEEACFGSVGSQRAREPSDDSWLEVRSRIGVETWPNIGENFFIPTETETAVTS